MFEKIIQYYKDQGKLHPHFEFEIRAAIGHYESRSEEVKAKFRRIKEKYNWEKRGNYEFDIADDIHIEFWRGSGNYDTSVCLSSDEGVGNGDNEIGTVIAELFWSQTDEERAAFEQKKQSIKVDSEEFPPILEFDYEIAYLELHHDIFYAWFAHLWQEVEGYECRMPVKIVQNNSVDMFSLNDYTWELYSKYNGFREEQKDIQPVEKVFNRKLSLEELFVRGNFEWDHWMSQNTNYWRYFEKGDQFIELGFYNNHTCQRSGKISENRAAEIQNLKEWSERKEVLTFMNEFVNQKTHEGWILKLRPLDLPKKVHEGALEFQTNFDWNGNKNDFSETSLNDFEAKTKIKIPKFYRYLLSLIDGKKQLGQSHFRISNTEAKKITKLFSLEEIKQNLPTHDLPNLEYMKIMEVGEDEFLCVNINNSKDKNGGIFLQNSNGELIGIANDVDDFLSLLCERY